MSSLSLHHKCLTETKTQIQSLDLTGIADASVRILSVATDRPADVAGTDRSTPYPFILIAPFGNETIGGPESQTDDITYPVLVVIVDKANQDQSTNLDRNLLWREEIIDHFHYNRFANVSGNNVTTVQPLSIVDATQFVQGNRWVSGLVINFECTRSRRAS